MRIAIPWGVRALALVAVLLAVPAGAWGDDADEGPTDWRAQAEAQGLSPADIERLGEQKVVIGVRSYAQIFSAYAACPVSVFVTSDSVIRAYNVLLEQSLGRVERARAREMPRVLRSIWAGLALPSPDDADLELEEEAGAAGLRRARILIGTALVLLGEEIADAPEDVAAAVADEVGRIQAGEGRHRSDWLPPSEDPLDTLDYDRFRPRSFYVGSDLLERYFRAAAWLQDVPFHLERKDDLLVVFVLANAFGRGWDRDPEILASEWSCKAFMRRYTRFLGKRGDPSIFAHGANSSLHGTRSGFLRRHPDLDDETRWDADLVVHVLPRAETADGRLLGQVFEDRIASLHADPMPGGLDLAAAMGSEAARRWCVAELGENAGVPDAWAVAPDGDDLFSQYLRALALLVDEPDPAAPDLFRGEAWSRKAANTVLSAWAQIRHAWALANPDSQRFFGTAKVEPGWVEPEPAFFGDFLDLCIQTQAALQEADAFDPLVGALEEIEALRSYVELIDRLEREGVLNGGYDAFWDAVTTGAVEPFCRELLNRYHGTAYRSVLERLTEAQRNEYETAEGKKRYQATVLREVANLVQQDVDRFETKRREDPEWARDLRDPLQLRKRWNRLALIVHRLEGLAVKQLRGQLFDEDDAEFLRRYAEKLAYPMLYDGNAYAHPPADRPRVASVFSAYPPTPHPRPDERGRVLHAGTGRPCAIYVLWPHEGREVLCRGGVMPYREAVTQTRLTDEQWRERLRSDDPPPVPAWLEPITIPLGAGGK